jgi:uncharacterized damage-inducible protein DinB
MNGSFLPTIADIFQSQLNNLEKEIDSFNEELLWAVKPGISNSGGNLALHLAGNLNQYIGAVIGKTGYTRDRQNEFSARDVPAAELLRIIQDTRMMISDVLLNQLAESDLEQEYPVNVFERPMTYRYFLLHLSAHLGYHSGQINYLRRMLHANA